MFLRASIVASVLALTSVAHANTIAITELLIDAEGEDSGREYAELYNYGFAPVDVTGWSLTSSAGTQVAVLPSATIAAGEFLILAFGAASPAVTIAQAKAIFEREWLGGVPNAKVIGVPNVANGNNTDDLVLLDTGDDVVWRLGYPQGEDDTMATVLRGSDWAVTDFGTSAAPRIVYAGNDLVVGILGYENTLAADPGVVVSDIAAIKDSGFLTSIGLPTTFYDNVDFGSTGTPLTGTYTPLAPPPPVPALPPLGLAALGGLILVGVRAWRQGSGTRAIPGNY